MKVLQSPQAARQWCLHSGSPRVLVPTMGALHEGHAALIRRAKRMAGREGSVVVSLFVNPTQFGPTEDFEAYPKPLASDLALCREAGADLVFHPAASQMYAGDHSTTIKESSLTTVLCGKSRPGHFDGVCTIVAKLFLILTPTHAVFGEKDWQQLAILRRMVRDLGFSVKIQSVAIVRERDGLALSSRNSYLTPSERAVASKICEALRTSASLPSPVTICRQARERLEKISGARVDYVEAVDAKTLAPLRDRSRPGRLAAAVFLGKARLIDNVPLSVLP